MIEEAKNPDSVLNKFSVIELSSDDLATRTVPVTSVTRIEAEVQEEERKIAAMQNVEEQRKATRSLDARKAIIRALPTISTVSGVTGSADSLKPKIRQLVMEKVESDPGQGQLNVFAGEILEEAAATYEETVAGFLKHAIDIPRIDLVQGAVPVWFEDFDLDVLQGFDFRLLEEEIIRRNLKNDEIDIIGVRQGAHEEDSPENQLVAEVLHCCAEVDYDSNADLLHKLVAQALVKLDAELSEKESLTWLVRKYRHLVARKICEQMQAHFRMGEPEYRQPKVRPFVRIEYWNFSALAENGYRDYRDPVSPVNAIPKYIWRGFTKACHFEYKFDSKAEKDFAFVLEHDDNIIKWLRPAPNQFRIYWNNSSKRFEPDFIAETGEAIYMIETKATNEIDSAEVLEKAAAALRYCAYATDFTTSGNGKPWKYLLISHDQLATNSSLDYLAGLFEMSLVN